MGAGLRRMRGSWPAAWCVLALAACGGTGTVPGADLSGDEAVTDGGRDVRDVRDPGTRDPGNGWDEGGNETWPSDGEEPDGPPVDSGESGPPPDDVVDPGDPGDRDAVEDAPIDAIPDAMADAIPDVPVDAAEPPADVVEPPTEIVEPPVEVVAPPPEFAEPPVDVVEPPPEIVEPPAEVVDPGPDAADILPDVADPGPDVDVVDPRCDRIWRIAATFGDQPPQAAPACLTYVPDGNYDATWCEFFLDGFAAVETGHYDIPFQWVEAQAVVVPVHVSGTILEVGMWVRYRDASTLAEDSRILLGVLMPDASAVRWQAGFETLHTGYMGDGSYEFEVLQYAFFLDVQRPTGTIERLWQSRGGSNWTWADAFTLPAYAESIPYGTKHWSDSGSAIFDPKHGCGY